MAETFITERRCRETGLTVELWRDLDCVSGYSIVCRPHGFVSIFETRKEAETFLPYPKSEGWCEICSGDDRQGEVD